MPGQGRVIEYAYLLNVCRFKRIRSVLLLDFKPECDCFLHPFKQLVN